MIPENLQHIQGEGPTMKWEDWYSELVGHFANAENITKSAAMRHMNAAEAKAWYDDGFTPWGCFRETYQSDGDY